ncbi:MAG: C10 family peptidase [Alistipes sp.]|nr:C10 family peptidase [Alistipes sp.]
MKKNKHLLLVLAGICFFASCQKDVEPTAFDTPTRIEASLKTNRITLQEAIEIATDGIAMLESTDITRANLSRRIDTNLVKYKINPATRAGEDADTLYYVVNYADNAGFAVVSTTRSNENPLLVVTEAGNYTPGEETENEGFNMYMDLLNESISRERLGIDPNPPEGPTTEYSIEEFNIGPFLNVKWGQGYPYNMYCPPYTATETARYPAGCVATAIAQIMSYHEYPTQYTPTYNTSIPTQYLNWTTIKSHVGGSATCNCTSHTQLAHLIAEVGEQANISYAANGSGSNIYFAQDCFEHFGYSSNTSILSYNFSSLTTELTSNGPVYMRGASSSEGHAWVADGYKQINYIQTTYDYELNGRPVIVDQSITTQYYLHLNWGWDGYNNGYFYEGVFNSANPYILDEGSSILANDNFNTNIKIITGLSSPNN